MCLLGKSIEIRHSVAIFQLQQLYELHPSFSVCLVLSVNASVAPVDVLVASVVPCMGLSSCFVELRSSVLSQLDFAFLPVDDHLHQVSSHDHCSIGMLC